MRFYFFKGELTRFRKKIFSFHTPLVDSLRVRAEIDNKRVPTTAAEAAVEQ
jgi:hypothetical protein